MGSEVEIKSGGRHCQLCGTGAFAADRFCRRCGARHHVEAEALALFASLAVTKDLDEPSDCVTAPLSPEDRYRAVSRPLLKAVTANLATPQTTRLKSRLGKSVTLTLISLPIWLLIVLLSPLDAYVAARATLEQ